MSILHHRISIPRHPALLGRKRRKKGRKSYEGVYSSHSCRTHTVIESASLANLEPYFPSSPDLLSVLLSRALRLLQTEANHPSSPPSHLPAQTPPLHTRSFRIVRRARERSRSVTVKGINSAEAARAIRERGQGAVGRGTWGRGRVCVTGGVHLAGVFFFCRARTLVPQHRRLVIPDRHRRPRAAVQHD